MQAISSPALADSLLIGSPVVSIEKSCSLFTAHPRPLALCQYQETRRRRNNEAVATKAAGKLAVTAAVLPRLDVARFSIAWNPMTEKESPGAKDLEHAGIKKPGHALRSHKSWAPGFVILAGLLSSLHGELRFGRFLGSFLRFRHFGTRICGGSA